MSSIPAAIDSVHIQGFRSLADFRLDGLPNATVLIGANGSGKSNFFRFFEMLHWMLDMHRLWEFIERYGGADDQLFGGSEYTKRMNASLRIRTENRQSDYRFSLAYANPDRLVFVDEAFRASPQDFSHSDIKTWESLNSQGKSEAEIINFGQFSRDKIAAYDAPRAGEIIASDIVELLKDCSIYQFQDTSFTSNFKKKCDVEDCERLRSDGGNLAAVLYRLKHHDIRRYERVLMHIGRVMPTFDCFQIEERHGKVFLQWKIKGMEKVIGSHLTSDGALRVFALMTLLNLPSEMLPKVLLIDMPELGLHPVAVELVAEMIGILALDRQVIVATQSPLLIDYFEIDQIVVLELRNGRTECKKLCRKDYLMWVDEESVPIQQDPHWELYTPGQLWQMNLFGGRP